MDPFQRILAKYRGSHILLVDPGGGFGDQLIFMGIRKQLTSLEVRHSILRLEIGRNIFRSAFNFAEKLFPPLQTVLVSCRPSVLERTIRRGRSRPVANPAVIGEFDAIVMNGGAYLNDIWKGYRALAAILPIARKDPDTAIIFAPQSFLTNRSDYLEEMVTSLGKEIHLFCREAPSYALLKSLSFSRNVHIGCSPDAAFYMSAADLGAKPENKYVLVAPRLDRESIVKWNLSMIWKIWPKASVRFGDVNLLPDLSTFVEVVARASKVFTDRLHVSILSSILGKETYLLPNSYHKNKGVYDFSLKHFSQTKFINTTEFPTRELVSRLTIESS
ncbi:MAG: polysaccharide pyruvyl transferase family protein [Candidatus Bathyarchaeia archaeon]|jgi:exopolysaccharide biosynthesis predicted pyruvyltransferase EpsI